MSPPWLGKFATKQAEKKQGEKKYTDLGKAMAVFMSPGGKATGKGSAKGSKGAKSAGKQGKGGGKPQPKHTAHPEGSWFCKRASCEWAQNSKFNLPWRQQCGCCLHKKNEALNPPAFAKIQLQFPPSTSLRQEQAKKDTTTKGTTQPSMAEAVRAEAHAQIPILASTKAVDMQEVHAAVKSVKTEARRVAFTEEQAEGFRMVAPAMLDVLESLAKERRPNPLKADKDPAATAQSFIKDSKHVGKSLDLAKAEEELTKAQAMHSMADEDDPLHDTSADRVARAQEKVDKLGKETPSENLRAHCLDEILAAYKRFVSAREDRAAKGKETAEARRQKRIQLVWQARQEIDAFEDALLTLEEEVQEEFDERALEQDAYDEEVMT